MDVASQSKALKWDGLDLWPALTGEAELQQRALYSAGPRFRSLVLREGDWKLIVYPAPVKEADAEDGIELFNLADDPNEKNNLAESKGDKVAELRGKLEAATARDGDAMVGSKTPQL